MQPGRVAIGRAAPARHNTRGVAGVRIPGQFRLMAPYLVVVSAVAGIVGHVRAPEAAGKPCRA